MSAVFQLERTLTIRLLDKCKHTGLVILKILRGGVKWTPPTHPEKNAFKKPSFIRFKINLLNITNYFRI